MRVALARASGGIRRNVASRPRERANARAVESRAASEAKQTASTSTGLTPEESKRVCAALAEDLTHLFDEVGIDASLYAPDVSFEDPLTKYDSFGGYNFDISNASTRLRARVRDARHIPER